MMDSTPPPPPGGGVAAPLIDGGGGGGGGYLVDFRFDPHQLQLQIERHQAAVVAAPLPFARTPHAAKLVLHPNNHAFSQQQQLQIHLHHQQQQQQIQIQQLEQIHQLEQQHHPHHHPHHQEILVPRSIEQHHVDIVQDISPPQQQHIVKNAVVENVDVWMDPVIWGRMPEKLMERIVASLPTIDSFFRFRSVSKKWYSLLFSDSFLELCTKVSPPRPCFLLFRPGEWSQGFLFNPATRAWHRLDLGFLPSDVAVVSSSRGLLCCMSPMAGFKTVIMCNPLTRIFLQLPNTLKERFVPTVGLVVEENPTASSSSSYSGYSSGGLYPGISPGSSFGYRLLVAGDDLISPFAVKNLTTEVYDSRLQIWCPAGALPRLCNLESAKTTYANGIFYCMNYSPFGILAYNQADGAWSKIQAPMRRFLRTPNLVECRGRLIMVAAVEKNRLNVPKSIRIWGLQHPKNSWVELERMPQGLYEEFMRISNERAFHCIGHGNIILITIAEAADILVYDLYDKLWRWIPRCPFVGEAEQQGLQGFAFDPCLESSVC